MCEQTDRQTEKQTDTNKQTDKHPHSCGESKPSVNLKRLLLPAITTKIGAKLGVRVN